jgi:FAD/FMN-containing dehydrogenase
MSNEKALPILRARQRQLPWVHSTIRVTRERWTNWSGELSSTPQRLYCDDARGPWKSPRTLEDLQQIVRDARVQKVAVRAFGSSHSWSKVVPCEGFLVDNRMIKSGDGAYQMALEPAEPGRKARVVTPPGLLSSELEHWLWKVGYTLPGSAVEDCFTIGGMVATATHGVGLTVPTTSDMVVGMTFVDGLGEVRRWTRETATADEIAAIQCGLGCLGLIYDITLEVEPRYETYHVAKTYPYEELFGDDDESRRRLRELHESHTSIEFFWWPFRFSGVPYLSKPEINPHVWVLATQREIPAGARPRGALRRFLHLQVMDLCSMVVSGYLMKFLTKFRRLTWLLSVATSFTNIWVLGRSGAWRMPQYDANHFVNAAGVEFTLAMASEWSVPFQPDAPDTSPEGWERVRQSFAVLHDLIVEAFARYPLRDPRSTPVVIAVEMRTLACSTALLSPGYQPDEQHAEVRYAAPELVTTADHPAWTDFAHAANLAMVVNPALGAEVRCHLAKPCHGFPHPAYPEGGMADYLRDRYIAAGTWHRFLAVREAVDPDGIFLNEFLREWFYPRRAEAMEAERKIA